MALRNRRLAELALFAALATLHTWPLAADPARHTRLDNDDTAFNTWVVAWVARQLPRDPAALFDAPIFHPAPDALAFSEHMLVPALLGAPLLWAGASPVLVYNLLVWAGHTLSGFAMAVVLRRWTGSGAAGVIGGSLYAFNAHLLTRYAHLQALHVEFFPIALLAFDRLLVAAGPRPAALFAAAVVLQALTSNYTMLFTLAAFAAALAVRPEPWRAGGARVWLWLSAAALGSALVLLPFVLPYLRVREAQGFVRTLDDVRSYSAGWPDYLATAARLHYDAWSHRFFANRTPLFPGITGGVLAAAAVITGLAWRDRRARMALAFGAVGFALSLGTSLPGYGWLHEHVPPLQGVRAVGRWGWLVLAAVAVLAGFAVARLEARIADPRRRRLLAAALLALVTVEALRAPLAMARFDGIPAVHERLAGDEVTAIVVFPLYGGPEFHGNARYLLDQTRHWKPMVNGYSSFAPAEFFARAARLQAFPAAAVLAELRTLGVSHVVLHRAPLEAAFGAPALEALRAHPELAFAFEDAGVIVYRLRAAAP